ncbi:hypothetical protein [Desulfovibrio sp. 86]|uniref:Uncharacterized protein n=1 Tax=uncultured Desulfovibrio sp. TaxID=167968 RepID=A0A212L7X6_9BACT|nr:hypothetical protein [Desulfovibrio sp. 86]SCM73429.1 hypothetical protein KL86DES1_21294 [uncultured Desulfovibrio sp.]VZH34190.1 conserved protein of unknown function [Desulfovibrio sp. 86]
MENSPCFSLRCQPWSRLFLRIRILNVYGTPVVALASADESRLRLHGERLLTQP